MKYRNILVTGGAGFIGANFIRYLFQTKSFSGSIVNLDKLTYAGNMMSLDGIPDLFSSRYRFVNADILNSKVLADLFRVDNIDCVVHFAAESHVDRSIYGPVDFVTTNINGTFYLLEAARKAWGARKDVRFHHISTDEVFGSLDQEEQAFNERTAYDPRSPYSATKASSDHLVRAYYHTYGLPITISNCSNNYGPYQFPEKLIPLILMNIKNEKPLPIYGDGKNIRDWLFVDDHASAITAILECGVPGETYLIGGENEWENIRLVKSLCRIASEKLGNRPETALNLITYVTDRPGHDRRYAVDCSKIRDKLGWTQSLSFEEGLSRTVNWYYSNEDWIRSITSGEYRKWIKNNYENR